jgi:hypothetical protein
LAMIGDPAFVGAMVKVRGALEGVGAVA